MNRTEFVQIAAVSLRELMAHKFRAFLTVLGVCIGVMAVIAISAIIHGLNSSVMDRVAALGSRSFFAVKDRMGFRVGRPTAEDRQRKDLTYADVEALRRLCRITRVISPFLTARSVFGDRYIVKYGDQRAENPIIRGVEASFPDASGTVIVQEGRFFSALESDRTQTVTVLGHGIAQSLFPTADPVGKYIRINGIPYEVVGVLEHQKGLFGGFSEDNYVLIPYGTFHKAWPEVKEMAIAFAVDDPGRMEAAMEEVEWVLRIQRGVRGNQPNNFSLFTANFLVDLWKQLTFVLFVITLVVASIGLLVGGIGVMNVMLVSVKERTREIGIRKAVGARKQDILVQFLLEAVVLTSLGGVLGILFAMGITFLLNALVPQLPARISLFWVIMGVGVSTSVGLIFGIWPARKAARMDPITCLHYE